MGYRPSLRTSSSSSGCNFSPLEKCPKRGSRTLPGVILTSPGSQADVEMRSRRLFCAPGSRQRNRPAWAIAGSPRRQVKHCASVSGLMREIIMQRWNDVPGENSPHTRPRSSSCFVKEGHQSQGNIGFARDVTRWRATLFHRGNKRL